nr:ATP-dependent protease subunit HslV [Candidatus Gromoviella agglomerans]
MLHGTTILCIRDGKSVIMIGDGQVSLGNTVMKSTAKKLRRIGNNKQIVSGFAGSTADALTLFDRLDGKLNQYSDDLQRACFELAKDWRSDKFLRKLEAMMIVADSKYTFLLTGNGDVLDPESNVVAIGSGGTYALSCALGLMRARENESCSMSIKDIALSSMTIASEICVFTNSNFLIEEVIGE